MQVKDVMRHKVTVAPVGTPVQDAFETMRQGGFRHLPVVDPAGKVVGILSDRDLRGVGAIFKDPATGAEDFLVTEDTTVDKIMVRNPYHVAPSDPIRTAIEIIQDKRIGCLVVQESGRLAGILSYVDLLEVLLKIVKDQTTENAA